MKIQVQFKQQPSLNILVNNTETGRLYFDLTRRQHELQEPYYRDSALWTPAYMAELAVQAHRAFGWNWLHEHYDLSITTQLHKDLERSVGQMGFGQIPEEYDSLLYDLHHCLHAIQNGQAPPRADNFQIEWLTDTCIPLPESFEFISTTSPGDLILINPYVGHNPLQIYHENDFTSLSTTCKFHDIIKPGIVLASMQATVSKEIILEKFIKHDPEFVQQVGADRIMYYAGSAKIGQVEDIQVHDYIKASPDPLVLESINFNE